MSIKSNFSTKLLIALFSLFLLINTSSLNAGWGKTDAVVEFDDIEWNQVFFKMNGLHYTASMPGYDGASLEDTSAYLTGVYAGAVYMIMTDIEDQYEMPRTQKEFLSTFEDTYTDFTIVPVNAKPFGAKYGVDLIPKGNNDTLFIRCIATNTHLITMLTNDVNEDTRHYFFNSLKVHPK